METITSDNFKITNTMGKEFTIQKHRANTMVNGLMGKPQAKEKVKI